MFLEPNRKVCSFFPSVTESSIHLLPSVSKGKLTARSRSRRLFGRVIAKLLEYAAEFTSGQLPLIIGHSEVIIGRHFDEFSWKCHGPSHGVCRIEFVCPRMQGGKRHRTVCSGSSVQLRERKNDFLARKRHKMKHLDFLILLLEPGGQFRFRRDGGLQDNDVAPRPIPIGAIWKQIRLH